MGRIILVTQTLKIIVYTLLANNNIHNLYKLVPNYASI